MDEVRWVVHFIDGDGSDDWQLMRNSHREYFFDENSALAFAEKYRFKNKPIYWQPTVHKEIEKTIAVKEWVREK
jgi:hypothetical protein